jgi:transposase-like protein
MVLQRIFGRRRAGMDPDLAEVILDLYAQGLSIRQIAAEVGVSKDAVWRVIRKHPERRPGEAGRDEVELLREAAERIQAVKQVLKEVGRAERLEEMGALERVAYAIGLAIGQALSTQLQQAAQARQAALPQTLAPAVSPPAVGVPTLDDLLTRFQASTPDDAARYLLHLAAAHPQEWGPGVELLKKLPEHQLDIYLDALAKQGEAGTRLAGWLRQNRDWTLALLRTLRAVP